MIAICCTNTFSKYLDPDYSEAGDGTGLGSKLRAVYPLSAMMAHSCVPNSEQSFGDYRQSELLELRATRHIAEGESITISYTELLTPTLCRQVVMAAGLLSISTAGVAVDQQTVPVSVSPLPGPGRGRVPGQCCAVYRLSEGWQGWTAAPIPRPRYSATILK